MTKGYKPVHLKESETQELRAMARRQGYLSIRELILAKTGIPFTDERHTNSGRRNTATIMNKKGQATLTSGRAWRDSNPLERQGYILSEHDYIKIGGIPYEILLLVEENR
jgi:hypothetical protein